MSDKCPYHDDLSRKVTDINDKMDRVLLALEGDEALGHRGLVKRVKCLESQHLRSTVWTAGAMGGAMVAFEWIKSHLYGVR